MIALPFFIFYPVSYPKDVFYEAGPATTAFNQIWLWFDAGNNCFPSLHTAICMLAIYYSRNFSFRVRWIIIPWAALVILSTVTCKQHYVVDVVAGMILCLLSIVIAKFFKLVK